MKNEIIIKTLPSFIENILTIKRNSEQNGNYSDLIFRGQSVDEPLLPRLARLDLRIQENSLKKTEELILQEFKRGILPLTEFKPENNWDLIALAQHHGLPTRLLDWSYSALAALWFAIENSPKRNKNNELENGVVWILCADSVDFNVDLEGSDPLKNDVTKIFRSNVVSRRISAQSGLFTVHFIRSDNSIVHFEDHRKFRSKLTKLTIPHNFFSALRKELSITGVNHSTLFPDLDGLTKHLEWRFAKLEDEKKRPVRRK